MNLFRRAWRVQVGSLVVADSTAQALDVTFKIKRTLATGHAGTCELEVFNLTPEHRHELVSLPRRTSYVEVQAGYVEGMSTLFLGDLRKAVVKRDGTDYVTTVTAGDGEHSIRTARVSRSFAPGTPLHAAADALAEALGVGVGNARDAFASAAFATGANVFAEGATLTGNAASELTRLCNAARLTWSVQDGNLQLLPLGGALERTAILLSEDTGMVGAPEIVNRRTITVTALLQPGLVPGQQVVVRSSVESARGTPALSAGAWRITEAEYAGDTNGGEWYAKLTCHRPLPPLVGPPNGGAV